MADNGYHIYIHFEGTEDKKSAVSGTGGSSSDSSESSSDSVFPKKVVNRLKKLVSFSAIKSTADTLINFEISQVSLKTGATEYEQRMNYVYSNASATVGAIGGLVGAGVVGGPAGFVVAAIGLAVTGAHKLISIAQKQQALQNEQSLENISIGMANIRAGTTGRRGGEQ